MSKIPKYRATPTTVDGIRFASKAEAEFYRRLSLWLRSRDVDWFLRQVPVDLPGGITYRADFLVSESGVVYFVDVKGAETAEFKLKRKLMRECCRIPLKVYKAVYSRGVISGFKEI